MIPRAALRHLWRLPTLLALAGLLALPLAGQRALAAALASASGICRAAADGAPDPATHRHDGCDTCQAPAALGLPPVQAAIAAAGLWRPSRPSAAAERGEPAPRRPAYASRAPPPER